MAEAAETTPQNQIKELKVSGHIMVLQPGLYCVFNAPGSTPPDDGSGLPGVRITPAPGSSASIATFQNDGWIGNDAAALVRVIPPGADVMVTIYQAPDSTASAPQLQVVRLGNDDAAAMAAPAATPAPQAAGRPAPDEVEVVAHIYARGDVPGRLGTWMGEPGSNRWIEGFGIAPSNGVPLEDVEYQAVLGRGWLSPWSEGGKFCGSRGMSLPILGLRVRLRGDSAQTHRVGLSASFVDGTRIGPVTDGEACEAPSLAALEAFQISLDPIEPATAKPRPPAAKTKAAAAKPAVKEQPKPTKTAKAPKPEPAPKPAAKPARRR